MPLSKTYQALSDPNRQKILELLKKQDLPVAEILKKLDITGASLSHHLNALKNADLVSSRRDGQQIFYSINLSVFEELVQEISKYLRP